jgi:TRAP-type uncharacterized transport system substrate-binding protein
MRPFCALPSAIAGASIVVLSEEPRSAPPPSRPTTMTIATASLGGVFVIYGQSMAEIFTEALGISVPDNLARGN